MNVNMKKQEKKSLTFGSVQNVAVEEKECYHRRAICIKQAWEEMVPCFVG